MIGRVRLTYHTLDKYTYIIAECLSTRHLILLCALRLRLYVCMYVCMYVRHTLLRGPYTFYVEGAVSIYIASYVATRVLHEATCFGAI